MSYRGMCIFCAVLMLAMLLAACSQGGMEERKTDENGRRVITFTCANLSKTDEGVIKVAVKSFENMHADATVDVKDMSQMGYDIDRYISVINTELMAGKGPDIIPITYLPAIKYFRKNIFADLGKMIEEDESFDYDALITNVTEAGKYNGTLYAIPFKFSLPGVIGSKKILEEEGIDIDDDTWQASDFIDISRRVTKDINGDGTTDRYALPKMPMESVVKLFINTGNFIDFENKKAYFDSPEFIELLRTLKSISDDKLTHKKIKLLDEIPYKNSQEVVFSGGLFEGYRALLGFKYTLGGGDRVFYRLPSFGEKKDYSFDSNLMLGIINTSANKELAWDFIKILLSKEIQSIYAVYSGTSGFPINREALEEQKKAVLKLDWRVRDEEAGWIPIRFTEDELSFIDNYISKVNTFQYSDMRIENIVIREIGPLFSKGFVFNTKDAEQIAESIQRKVQLYLDE